MFLPTSSLSDGQWHRVHVTWLGSDISVSVDYGLRTVLLPMLANKIQGQYIGKILIGGPDSTAGLLASEVGYFEGCIQVSFFFYPVRYGDGICVWVERMFIFCLDLFSLKKEMLPWTSNFSYMNCLSLSLYLLK